MYPPSLIHRRKGNWSHVGSIPTSPTKNIKNNKNYLEVSNFFVIFVLLKFFKIIFGPIAQLVRAGDS